MNSAIPYRPLTIDTTASFFKMTIDTTIAGDSNPQSFTLPFGPDFGGAQDCTVYWGDGTSDDITYYNQAEATHGYSASGVYQISIKGTFSNIKFNGGGDKLKLLSVDQWGTNPWLGMGNAFFGCSNMVGNWTDVPDTSSFNGLSGTFRGCTNFNTSINDWDTSLWTSMNTAFQETAYNHPILFNTSNITSWAGAFKSCLDFNQPLDFDMSATTSMNRMLQNCQSFNQTVNINVPNLITADGMFLGCNFFNSPVTLNTTSALTYLSQMFDNMQTFNSPVIISDTSGVIAMRRMFSACISFNQDISSFDISGLQTFGLGTSADKMLESTSLSTANYDLLLVAWDAYGTSGQILGALPDIKYSAGAPATARQNMIDRGWTISDGGQA